MRAYSSTKTKLELKYMDIGNQLSVIKADIYLLITKQDISGKKKITQWRLGQRR